ncbi:MAG: N-6 DNA methylase, partial [Bacillota bacterium]
YKPGRAQNFLLDEHVETIYKYAIEEQDVEGISKVVTLEEIHKKDYNLNIHRYINKILEVDTITLEDAIQNLRISVAESSIAEELFVSLLKEAGLLNE